MSNPDLYITESCVPVLWNCSAGTQLIDPCSCFQYYECRGHGNGVVERKCAPGTAYNHDSKNCVKELDVLRTQCPRNEPWDRCGLNGTQTDILKQRCKNDTSIITTTTSNPVTKPGTSGSDGNEVGIILGGLFGGLFVVVVAILIALLFHRHRAKTKSKLTKKRSVQNPEYNFQPEPSFEPPQEEEETYHVIDDNMNDPTYNSDSVTVKPPSLPNRGSTGDTIGGSDKMGNVNNNFQLHNSDTLTSQREPINFHSGTGNMFRNGKAAAVSDEPETSNYITIFPHEKPDENETTSEVFEEETPYDNTLVSRSDTTGKDTKF
ncbi:uncharacterized protein LOC133194649 isoform X2 [Saccostrea echinata]|nr:uncharacterized protein LOC133194649 isoform X2 [Saccostrea echinata]